MSWLIAFYTLIGVLQIGWSLSFVGAIVLHAQRPDRQHVPFPVEDLTITLMLLPVAILDYLVAIGLLLRWRLVRLTLLGICWWGFITVPFVSLIALASLLDMQDSRGGPLDPHAGTTLLIGAGVLVVCIWHYVVLMHPEVRQQFARSSDRPAA